ncbi:MAG: hypothetical protein MUC43_03730 [Pirellula sp.]|jgi:hypothetical protein|nr:hypothetical protein [Pirellula sp.]
MARYDDLNTKMIAYATVLSIVVLVIVLQGLQALTYALVNSEDARKIGSKSDAGAVAKGEQLASLDGYKKLQVPDETSATPNATKEIFQIPISEAKKLVLQEMGQK